MTPSLWGVAVCLAAFVVGQVGGTMRASFDNIYGLLTVAGLCGAVGFSVAAGLSAFVTWVN